MSDQISQEETLKYVKETLQKSGGNHDTSGPSYKCDHETKKLKLKEGFLKKQGMSSTAVAVIEELHSGRKNEKDTLPCNVAELGNNIDSNMMADSVLEHVPCLKPSVKRRRFGPYKPYDGGHLRSMQGETVETSEKIHFEVERSPYKSPFDSDELEVIGSSNAMRNVIEPDDLQNIPLTVELIRDNDKGSTIPSVSVNNMESVSKFEKDLTFEENPLDKIKKIKLEFQEDFFERSDSSQRKPITLDSNHDVHMNIEFEEITPGDSEEQKECTKKSTEHCDSSISFEKENTTSVCQQTETELNCDCHEQIQSISNGFPPVTKTVGETNQEKTIRSSDEVESTKMNDVTIFAPNNTINDSSKEENKFATESLTPQSESTTKESSSKRNELLKDYKYQTRRTNQCSFFNEIYNIKPCSVVLENIQFSATACTKWLNIALQKLHPRIEINNTESMKLNDALKRKCPARIVPVGLEAGSETVGKSFEELVAKKLAEKRKQLGLPENFLLESPTKESSSERNDLSKTPILCEKDTPDSMLNSSVVSSSKTVTDSFLCSSETVLYDNNLDNNQSFTPIMESNKIPLTFVPDGSVPVVEEKGVSSREFFNENTLLYKNMQLHASKVTSTRKCVRSFGVIPEAVPLKKVKKSPPLLTVKFPFKKRPSNGVNQTENGVCDTFKSSESPSQTVVDDSEECEAIRTVPLHPRVRMKLKSNCSTGDCSVKSPTRIISKISLISPKFAMNKGKQFVSSTPIVIKDVAHCLPNSSCNCNIINCAHVKTPSPKKRSEFDLTIKAISPTKSGSSSPNKWRSRPSLLPKTSPLDSHSLLSKSINSPKKSVFHVDRESQVDIESDSSSSHSSCEEIIYPNVVHISSDEDDIEEEINSKDDKSLLQAIIKTEACNNEPSFSASAPMDNDEDFPVVDIVKRRRKTSSINRIETYTPNPTSVVPTFVKPSEMKESDTDIANSGRLIKSVSKRQMLRLVEHFKLKRVSVKSVKLSQDTIDKLVQLCAVRETWNDKTALEKAGLSQYDIQRLGLASMRKDNANYTFRKFLKRRNVFECMLENPKASKKKSRELHFLKSQKTKLKALKMAQEREKRKVQELESIRRSLLKINAKLMKQSSFWNYLSRGTSPLKPIEL